MTKVKKENEQAFDIHNVSGSTVTEAILNDVQIKALNERLKELMQYNSPRYIKQTNGEFKAVNSIQFDEVFEKIISQIKLRQDQIMSDYNFR